MDAAEGLVTRQTVTDLVRAYEQAENGLRVAFARIARAQDDFAAAFGDSFDVRSRFGRESINFHDSDEAVDRLKRQAWRVIVERLEIRRMMSVKRAEEVDQQLEKGDLPAITVDSVFAFVRGISENLGTMLEESVQEVFDWLRPRHKRYKTNSEFEIGPRVILAYVVEDTQWLTSFYRVNYRYNKELVALENVFTALDGKGSIAKGRHQSVLADAINTTPLSVGRGETEYFRFRCCKNRNLHLEFERPDLLARLNQIAGGMRLREKTGAA